MGQRGGLRTMMPGAHDEQDIARWVDSVRTQGYVIIE